MSTSSKLILPTAFEQSFVETFGTDEYNALYQALQGEESPTTVRLNPLKALPTASAELVPWCTEGIYLQERPIFGADPWWHAGAYYVQEPASMIVSQYIRQCSPKPELAIDLCAAPGGKSTLLRSALPKDTVLIANEPEPSRAKILRENFTRYGSDEVIVTNVYPEKLRDSGVQAQLILVDAPCSGEGMFRKEPDALTDWSPENVAISVERQQSILTEAWEMLALGGLLIYSTCTYNTNENEGQLEFLQRHYDLEVLPLKVEPSWGVREGTKEAVYRFFPHHTRSEGLSIFGVRKLGGSVTAQPSVRSKSGGLPKELSALPKEHVRSTDGVWSYLSPRGHGIVEMLKKKKVRMLLAGVPLGQEKGKDFIPLHNWVTSGTLAHLVPYPTYECSQEEALAFLKRETLQITAPRGYIVLTYSGVPIGLVKNLGNRANNLYPKELTIRNTKLGVKEMPTHRTITAV